MVIDPRRGVDSPFVLEKFHLQDLRKKFLMKTGFQIQSRVAKFPGTIEQKKLPMTPEIFQIRL